MSTPSIARIISAAHCPTTVHVHAKNPLLQRDVDVACHLFMQLTQEMGTLGQLFYRLQAEFPHPYVMVREKGRLELNIEWLKADMDRIHNMITLLVNNPMPYLGTCIDFWTWAEQRFQLTSSAQKHKG